MDKSRIVGLITGLQAVPQEDLSLQEKVLIVRAALQTLQGEIENIVTGAFIPFDQFAHKREGGALRYGCRYPTEVSEARVSLIFATRSENVVSLLNKNWVRFDLRSALLTSKGKLFWIEEECSIDYSSRLRPIPSEVFAVKLLDLAIQAHGCINLYPELFLSLMSSFEAVAQNAFDMRARRQTATAEVIRRISWMNDSVGNVPPHRPKS